MIHSIVHSPAGQVLAHTSAVNVVTAFVIVAVLFAYHRWIRKHMWTKAVHWLDLATLLLALDVGVILALFWPGQWMHSLFAKIATWWDSSPSRTGGDGWATVVVILLVGFLLGAIIKVGKGEHQGPVTGVLIAVALVPVLLVATQGTFGYHTAQVVNALAHPSTFGTW